MPNDVASNLPGAVINVTPGPNADRLVLRSSNLQREGSTLNYIEWFAEVENTGTTPACHTRFKVTFENAAGANVLELDGFADAEAYDTSLTSSVPCIGPGKTGVLWTNALPESPVPIAGIANIEVMLYAQNYPGAVPHPDAPTVTAAITPYSIISGGGYWSVSGTVRSTATIYNLGLDAYPVSSAGLVVDSLSDHHLETFLQGASWQFETTGYEGTRPARHHLFVSFIEGAEPALNVQASAFPNGAQNLERERRRMSAARRDRVQKLAIALPRR